MKKSTSTLLGAVMAALVFAFASPASAHENTYLQGHECGGTKIGPRVWTAWETVETKCGVELQVRYNMKRKFFRRYFSTVQFRYVNTMPCPRSVTLSNVQLQCTDGSVQVWDGESYSLADNETVEGNSYTINCHLCKFTYDFDVR